MAVVSARAPQRHKSSVGGTVSRLRGHNNATNKNVKLYSQLDIIYIYIFIGKKTNGKNLRIIIKYFVVNRTAQCRKVLLPIDRLHFEIRRKSVDGGGFRPFALIIIIINSFIFSSQRSFS